jgi:hypothetical protein
VRLLWGAILAPPGPLIMGLDDPRERRRGPKIHATGSSRDPVRASPSQLVNGRGLRWVSLMLLVPLPGPNGAGPCRSGRCGLPLNATIRSGARATRS